MTKKTTRQSSKRPTATPRTHRKKGQRQVADQVLALASTQGVQGDKTMESDSSLEISSSEHDRSDIMVVDDDIEIVNFLEEMLTDEGYTVRGIHSGPEALAAITAAPPALVLLDLSMPGMNGVQVLKELRQSGFVELPIVIMTANLRAEPMVTEATGYITKPFDIDILLNIVAQYAGNTAIANEIGQANEIATVSLLAPDIL